jgi:tripartite-type tricarboxylate transporter receptor subunit TctC
MNKRQVLQLLGAGALGLPSLALAQAGAFPSRLIRVVSPFAAGSTSDTSARFVAQHLSIAFGQAVTVDNQPGADGRIGMMTVKNAPADGYTMVAGSWTNLAVNPVLIKDLPYDPLKDFKPVAGIGRSMLGIAVSGRSGIKSLAELIAAAKKNPGKLNFGNFAMGYRLATEWFSSLAGVKFTHVPYKTTSQMNTDLISQQIDVSMDGVTSMDSLAKSGQIRILAVTGDRRHADFPDVPTVKESFPEYSIYGWTAFMVRSATPDAITEKLSSAVQKILLSKEGQEFARKVGSELFQGGAAEMRKYQAGQIETLRRVAEAAGIKPE